MLAITQDGIVSHGNPLFVCLVLFCSILAVNIITADVEAVVIPVLLDLVEPDGLDDFRAEAIVVGLEFIKVHKCQTKIRSLRIGSRNTNFEQFTTTQNFKSFLNEICHLIWR